MVVVMGAVRSPAMNAQRPRQIAGPFQIGRVLVSPFFEEEEEEDHCWMKVV